MITILIADDEKLERNGIKFLLKRENEEFQILEAANGKEAVGILQKKHVDILFSDIKMPYLTGLELAKQAREMQPDIEIVIFSGYNDFSYAKEALHYGVVDYVLKPVDPIEFHETFLKVKQNVMERDVRKEQYTKQQDYLGKYFLLNYLYYGKSEDWTKAAELIYGNDNELGQYTHMILAGSADHFFEVDEEKLLYQLRESIQRQFLYLNLTAGESLFLFKEKFSDYGMVAEELYQFFKNKYNTECYFAVREEISDYQEMPNALSELEKVLEGQFYQPKHHVFLWGREDSPDDMEKIEDSEVLKSITEDIKYKDVIHLRQDFKKLEQKYRTEKQFSEMYVKFVFSNVIKEVYEAISSADVKELSKQVDKLYRCRKLQDVIDITDKAVQELEKYVQEQNQGFREEITKIKSYILHHYAENLNAEILAKRVYLSPGYLSAIFKEETGVNLNRFIRDIRMNKAKELLENTNMKISQISKSVGISNNSYFCRSFREYFGSTPESCRKGTVNDESIDSQI